jgi:hypothetical protein
MKTASLMIPSRSQAMITSTGNTASCTQRGTVIVPLVSRSDPWALAPSSSTMDSIIAVGTEALDAALDAALGRGV